MICRAQSNHWQVSKAIPQVFTTVHEVSSVTADPPKSQQGKRRQREGEAATSLRVRLAHTLTGTYGSYTLTYGPQDGVEGAHVLPARLEVLPSDLKLAIRELPHSQGGAAPQELGALRSHVLCDQG